MNMWCRLKTTHKPCFVAQAPGQMIGHRPELGIGQWAIQVELNFNKRPERQLPVNQTTNHIRVGFGASH